jgi:RNA-directed DNA polymerase
LLRRGKQYFCRHCPKWYLGASPSKKSVRRLTTKVGELLVPGNHDPWPKVRDELNAMLRGWSSCFGYGTRLMAYRAVDNYLYEAVRHFLRRRHGMAKDQVRRDVDDWFSSQRW